MSFGALFPLMVTPRHPLRVPLAEALAAIEAAHDWPEGVPAIGVRTEPMLGLHGLFDRDRPEFGVRVWDHAPYPRFTLAHEIGHALDAFVLGEAGRYASRGGSSDSARFVAWEAWRTALDATPTVQSIRALQNDDYPEVADLAVYLLRPEELFARAYAQFVAMSVPSAGFEDEWRRLLLQEPRPQWPGEEFATLQAPLSAILRNDGR